MPADRFIHPRAGRSHKITMLTDLEFRVWIQYLLSSDDFGVMHATAVALQNDNLHLANRPAKIVKRCLDALIASGLVRQFEHQGQPYVFQHDWQRWQKVEYPRATVNPSPSPADFEKAGADQGTRDLFIKHPGGQRKDRRRSEDVPNDSGRASQTHPEGVPPTRAQTRETATANANGSGQRLTADGPPYDVWLADLLKVYPAHAVSAGPLTEQAFLHVFEIDRRDPGVVYAELRAAIENQLLGPQWKAGKVPKFLNWLREGLYKQRHEAIPSSSPASKVPTWLQRKAQA